MEKGSSGNSIGERGQEKGDAAWGHAAYRGTRFETRIASLASHSAATPLGSMSFSAHLPRVAHSSRWALMRNPFGIEKKRVKCLMLVGSLFLVTATMVVGQSIVAPPVQTQTTTGLPAAVSALPAVTQPANFLAWEADSKEFEAKQDDLAARFAFYVTNVSAEVVVITSLQRTCGCTEASMAAQPWRMAPGANEPIRGTIDRRSKSG